MFIREIMEFWQERYEKSIKKDREKKREARHRKSELVAENHKEQKVAPDKNTSVKKLKNRLKKQR
jgi:uncharacterized protein YlxW (UPF0749 family)